MADIFISYSSRYRDHTRALADVLVAEGYSVWWDTELEASAAFRHQIDSALSQARIVVVIWSEGAAASDYVIAEAREALVTSRLINVLAPGFDPFAIPKPFGEYQAEKIENIPDVIRAIARRWAGEVPEKLDAAGFYERASGKPALSPKREAVSSVAHVSPALLLNARLAISPYLDVHGLRAGTAQWAQEGRPLRGRLIHGPGGLGKTRLMAEVCAGLRAQDWAAGFVETPTPKDADILRQAIEHLIDTDRYAGLMLVLDYAERRHAEAVRYAALMAKASISRPHRKLRLVLLARSAGEWWDRVVDETPELQAVFGGRDSIIQLAPFAETEQRERLFNEAAAGFRQAIAMIRRDDPEAFSDWGDLPEESMPELMRAALSQNAYARPLMIQIAALLRLQGETPDASTVAGLLDAMLGVERRYWKTALGAAHSEHRQAAIVRGTIQTTLAGGVARTAAEALLLGDTYYRRETPAEAAEALADIERLYGDGTGTFLSLEPDLVGEHLVAADGDERLLMACLNWAGEDVARRRNILTVLNRASRPEHGAKTERAVRLLDAAIVGRGAQLAADVVAVAIESPGQLGDRVAAVAAYMKAADRKALLDAMPLYTFRLRDAAATLAEAAVLHARAAAQVNPDDGDTQSELAQYLLELGGRLSDLGRREAALSATQEAVDINRQLVSRQTGSLEDNLARALNQLGNRLSDLRRTEEALAASQEATALFRRLVANGGGEFRLLLSSSLNNLGIRLLDLSRLEEALVVTQEAVSIRRQLAQAKPDKFLDDLALSLGNLGLLLARLEHHHEALAVTQEGVEIYRVLAKAQPDAFLSSFAESLDSLGSRLSALGRREEALALTQQALDISRQLAEARPEASLPGLAKHLNNWGVRLSKLGRHEEALTAAVEAVGIRRKLVEGQPDVFLSDLASSLQNIGVDLFNLGRNEDALAATQEAVDIRRKLAQARPGVFLSDLATSLSVRGALLHCLGRGEDALASVKEAADIQVKLAQRQPDDFLLDRSASFTINAESTGVSGLVYATLEPQKRG